MASVNEFKLLKDSERREELLERGAELVERIQDDRVETVVWLDRAARPFAWFTEELWRQRFPELSLPDFVFLNIGGEKNLRQKYMPDAGFYNNNLGEWHQQFVGIFDTEENIALFEQRIRDDREIQQQLQEELGSTSHQLFTGKNILIVDHMEFEGVSRLFTEAILDETYSPNSVGYFEFGQQYGGMPTGLENPIPDPSFIARESTDPEEIQSVRVLRQELRQLVLAGLINY